MPFSSAFNLVQIIILNLGMPSIDKLLPAVSFSARAKRSLCDLRTVNLYSLSSFLILRVILPFLVIPFSTTFPFTLNLRLNSFIFFSLLASTVKRSIKVVSIIAHHLVKTFVTEMGVPVFIMCGDFGVALFAVVIHFFGVLHVNSTFF